jgi:hypothetical protein
MGLVGLVSVRLARMVGGMGHSLRTITFESLPCKASHDWHVLATYPSGHREHITGFKNKQEAQEWMKSDKCQEWVKKRGYDYDPSSVH